MTTSPLASRAATRDLLDEFGLATKHRFGQNFLVDNHVIERICALAELSGSELVLEVGPGIGTLTLALVQEARRVVAIEADAALEPVLAAHADDCQNFSYIMGDALRTPPARIEKAAGGAPTHFISNLPYNVAATVILSYFEQMSSIARAVVMVQKEVADRIAAQPGTKDYGAYTVKLALHAQVTGRFEVPPQCFVPAPHVDSAVVRLDRLDSTSARAEALAQARVTAQEVVPVVEAAFAQRRKTIRNSMSAHGFAKDEIDTACAACGIAPTARAETLLVEDFIALTHALRCVDGNA